MVTASRARRTLRTVEESDDTPVEKMTTFAKDVRENIVDAGEAVSRTAQDAASTVSQRMRDVGVDPDRIADTAKEQVSKLQEAIEEELRERPLRTLAIAAAVGLVAGLLSTR